MPEICFDVQAYTLKPLLDGKAVMQALGLKSGGPQLGAAMAKVTLISQSLHPKQASLPAL